MKLRFMLACASVTAIAACVSETPSAGPSVPSGPALTAAEIPAAVEGGPYALTIYDGEFAGTTGRSTWDFSAGVVSGSFTTADGQTGTFENPISIEGNTLCSGTGDSKQCHLIYNYQGGFLEVNADGSIHAASLPN